jgi:hypothetical protein
VSTPVSWHEVLKTYLLVEQAALGSLVLPPSTKVSHQWKEGGPKEIKIALPSDLEMVDTFLVLRTAVPSSKA